MSTTQSFPPFNGPRDTENPLELLARVAAEAQPLTIPLSLELSNDPTTSPSLCSSTRLGARRYGSPSPSESSDFSASSRSSMSPTPTLVDRSDAGSTSSSPVSSWKVRKACHRSPKISEAQKCARAAKEPRRKEVLGRALLIKTVENSPVNDQQLRVLYVVPLPVHLLYRF